MSDLRGTRNDPTVNDSLAQKNKQIKPQDTEAVLQWKNAEKDLHNDSGTHSDILVFKIPLLYFYPQLYRTASHQAL